MLCGVWLSCHSSVPCYNQCCPVVQWGISDRMKFVTWMLSSQVRRGFSVSLAQVSLTFLRVATFSQAKAFLTDVQSAMAASRILALHLPEWRETKKLLRCSKNWKTGGSCFKWRFMTFCFEACFGNISNILKSSVCYESPWDFRDFKLVQRWPDQLMKKEQQLGWACRRQGTRRMGLTG